jgi:hypothetical protein
MALVFDNRDALQGKPVVHALIAGVSLYRHLPGGGGKLAKEDWQMQQLTSTALTAYKIYHWLVEHRKQLPVELATVRLLLSPSAKERPEIERGMQEISELMKSEPQVKLSETPSACSRKDFAREALYWSEDAKSENRNITFFYFAGHGIQRKNDDPILLLEDFGDPEEGMLAKTFAFDKFYAGMVPSKNQQQQMARTQLYFIDACRVIPQPVEQIEYQEVSGILSNSSGGLDNRSSLICYGTVSNALAYAAGKQTLFSEALVECLEGLGGDTTGEEDEHGNAKWHVSIDKLYAAIEAKGEIIRNLGLDQEFYPTRRGKNNTVVKLEKPPEVDCRLFVQPDQALQFVTVDVTNFRNKPVWINLSPVNPHPYLGRLPAGLYNVIAKITDPPKPPYNDSKESFEVKPLGNRRLKARVGA